MFNIMLLLYPACERLSTSTCVTEEGCKGEVCGGFCKSSAEQEIHREENTVQPTKAIITSQEPKYRVMLF